jgi:cytochrome P450
MNHHFTPRKIKLYTKSFSTCAMMLVQDIINSHLKEEFDLLPLLERSSVRAVCATLFGMDENYDRVDDVYEATSTIFEA